MDNALDTIIPRYYLGTFFVCAKWFVATRFTWHTVMLVSLLCSLAGLALRAIAVDIASKVKRWMNSPVSSPDTVFAAFRRQPACP